MLGVDVVDRLGAVGDERVMTPVGKQLGLIVLGVQVHATHDQPVGAERRLGQLADARVGVVGDGLPSVVGDQSDLSGHDLVHRHADRELTALPAQARDHLLIPEPRVGAQQDLPGRAGAPDAGEQLVDEAQRPALRVRRTLAQANMQDLAGIGARREDRVVAELVRVAVARALLGVTVDLADETVDVDHQPPHARAGARLPRALERLRQDSVELADMPEGKGP